MDAAVASVSGMGDVQFAPLSAVAVPCCYVCVCAGRHLLSYNGQSTSGARTTAMCMHDWLGVAYTNACTCKYRLSLTPSRTIHACTRLTSLVPLMLR
jgi:hypothetical protein